MSLRRLNLLLSILGIALAIISYYSSSWRVLFYFGLIMVPLGMWQTRKKYPDLSAQRFIGLFVYAGLIVLIMMKTIYYAINNVPDPAENLEVWQTLTTLIFTAGTTLPVLLFHLGSKIIINVPAVTENTEHHKEHSTRLK